MRQMDGMVSIGAIVYFLSLFLPGGVFCHAEPNKVAFIIAHIIRQLCLPIQGLCHRDLSKQLHPKGFV
jgi:hypothetical protein